MKIGSKLLFGGLLMLITCSTVFAQALRDVMITDFANGNNGWTLNKGKEFPPGAKGMLSMFRAADGAGLKITYDFTDGGNYIAINKGFPPINIKELKLRIKTMAKTIAIRFKDSQNQSLQMYVNITPGPEWQDVRIAGFENPGNFPSHWGGPNDGILHQPVSMVDIVFGKDNCPLKGETCIGNVSAVAAQ